MALTPEQVNDYFKTQNPSATPLSPAQYEASLNKPAAAPAAPAPVATSTTLAQDQAKAANQGKPGYDVFGNAVPGYQAPSTSPSPTTVTNVNDQLAQTQADFQATAKQVQDTLTGIQNGAIPLSSGDQAQVDALKSQFEGLIRDQTLTNTGTKGLATMRGFQGGNIAGQNPLFYANMVGTVISAGAAKVSDLQVKEAGAVAALTQSLKDNNAKSAKDAWDVYQTAYTERRNALQKTIDDANKAIADAQKAKIDAAKVEYDTITKPLNDLASSVAKNGAPAAIVNAIKSAGDVGAGIAAAGGWLQEATGDLGRYLDYKRSAEATGKVAAGYDDWLKADKAATSQQKINEAYSTAYASAKGKAAGELAAGGGTVFKPLTESQGRDLTYAQRADQGNTIIDSLQDTVTSMDPTAYASSKFAENNVLLNQYVSPELRQIRQAERNFLTAVLRRESGAQISDSEFNTGELQYFPRPGDDTTTLQNKADLRALAINSFKQNVPNYDERIAQTPGGMLNKAEDLAENTVTDYAAKATPDQQASIRAMVAGGKSYTDIVKLLGI